MKIQRYFMECSYLGTHYSGWQIQPNALTIQEVIESRLSQLYSNEEIHIVGCGRTDAGVHAKQAFFHVDLPLKYDLVNLQFKLNNMLPQDISIQQIIEVEEDRHARFDAERRTYCYHIHTQKNPFLNEVSWYNPYPLKVKEMNEATKYLLGRQDFTSFSKLHTDVNNNFCEIYAAEWKEEGERLFFEITSNRFLRDMVRAIVGTLLKVGKGELEPLDMKRIIELKNRGEAGLSVPAVGLFLERVDYPFLR